MLSKKMVALTKSAGQARTVELSGFLSSDDDRVLRLHPTLDPSRYFDIPKSAVVSTFTDAKDDERMRIVVRGDAEVVVVSTLVASASDLADERVVPTSLARQAPRQGLAALLLLIKAMQGDPLVDPTLVDPDAPQNPFLRPL